MQDTVIAIWKTVTKSLVSKPACKMYPVQPAVLFDNTRGSIEIDAAKCIVCTLCDKKCPTGAIVVDKVNNTWAIDRFKCILCSACTESCKPKCLTMVNHYTGPVVKNEIETHPVTPPKRKKKKAGGPEAAESKAEAAPPATAEEPAKPEPGEDGDAPD